MGGSGSGSGSGGISGRSSPPGYTSEPYEGPLSEQAAFSMPTNESRTDASRTDGGFTTATGVTGTEISYTEGSSGLPSLADAREVRSQRAPLTPMSEYSAWASGDSSGASLLRADAANEFAAPRPGFLSEKGPSSAWSSTARGQASGSTTPQWFNAQSQRTSVTATPGQWRQDLHHDGSTYMSAPEGEYHGTQETLPSLQQQTVARHADLPPLPPSDTEPSSGDSSGYRTSASHALSRQTSRLSRSDRVTRRSAGSAALSERSVKTRSQPPSSSGGHRPSPSSVHSAHRSNPSAHSSVAASQSSSSAGTAASFHQNGPGSSHSGSPSSSHHSPRRSRPSSRQSGPPSQDSTASTRHLPASSLHDTEASSHLPDSSSQHSSARTLRSLPKPGQAREVQPQPQPQPHPFSIQVNIPISGPPGSPSSGPSSSSGRTTDSTPTARSHSSSERTGEATADPASEKPRHSSSSSGTYRSVAPISTQDSPLLGRLLKDPGFTHSSDVSSPRSQPIKAWAAGVRPPASEAGNQSYYTDPTASSPASHGPSVAPPTLAARSTAFATAERGPSTAGHSFATGRTSMYATAGTAEYTAPSELQLPSQQLSAPSIAATNPDSPFGTPPFVSAVPVSPGWSTHRGLPSYAPSEADSVLPSRPWSVRGTTPSIPEERFRSTTPISIADVEVADLERMSSIASSGSRFTEFTSHADPSSDSSNSNRQSSSDNRRSTPSNSRGYRTASTHESYKTGTVAYTTAEGTRYRSAGSTP